MLNDEINFKIKKTKTNVEGIPGLPDMLNAKTKPGIYEI